MTPGPVVGIPTVEEGLRSVPTTVYFVTGGTAECTPQWTAPVEEYSVVSFPVGALQSHLPHTADQKHGSEMNLGASTPTIREQTLPETGL